MLEPEALLDEEEEEKIPEKITERMQNISKEMVDHRGLSCQALL